MGSSGSGNFGTYHTGTHNEGEGNGEIKCPQIIEMINLEDVATSEFYTKHHAFPSISTPVMLRNEIVYGRLVVETEDNNEILGNLPTEYNYLIDCIHEGLVYIGVVLSSGDVPIPYITVKLNV